MKKWLVTFSDGSTFRVEANTEDDAGDIAEGCLDDKEEWVEISDIDEITSNH